MTNGQCFAILFIVATGLACVVLAMVLDHQDQHDRELMRQMYPDLSYIDAVSEYQRRVRK